MHQAQRQALTALAQAFTDLFIEAGDLLPLLIAAEQKRKPFPRWDTAHLAAVAAALSFVEDGRPKFFTLAHIDDGKVDLREQEELVWIAMDAETCRSIAGVPELTRARGLGSFFGFGSSPQSAQHRHILQRNTQSIAIRAAYLAHFTRFALEYSTSMTPETLFSPAVEMAQQHFQSYQRDIERIAPALVDQGAARSLLMSLSFPIVPLIVAHPEDENSRKLNGIPLTRELEAACLNFLAKQQSQALTNRSQAELEAIR